MIKKKRHEIEETLANFINIHPYLFVSILYLLAAFPAAFIIPPLHRHLVILSGLASLPCVPFIVFLEGDYWRPFRWGGWPLGIEDVFCSFGVAAMGWIVALWPLRHRLIPGRPTEGVLRRYFILGSLTAIVFLILYSIGLSAMPSLMLSYCITSPILLFLRRDLYVLSLAGIAFFTPVHLILMKAGFWFWPQFVWEWNTSSLWGRLIFGLPLGEVIWAMTFGVFWPHFIGCVLNLKLFNMGLRASGIKFGIQPSLPGEWEKSKSPKAPKKINSL